MQSFNSVTKEQFKEAVESDRYAEYHSENKDVTLITDWEGDGSFNPYIIADPDLSHQTVSDTIVEMDVIVFEEMSFDTVQNGIAFWTPEFAKVIN